jgi:D-arabinose 1-dehydrogenase-like Zn-dependent alcohol dehydrogenase
MLAGVPAGALNPPVGNGPYAALAYGATSAKSPLGPLEIQRRALGAHDVLIDVLFCGVCHSDIHQARDEWSDWGATVYPCVPGHEIIGRVVAVGDKVTKFKVGDIGGVGCMVDSCGACDFCRADREQNCARGATFTYNSLDKHNAGPTTYGGYSEQDRRHRAFRDPHSVRRRPCSDCAAAVRRDHDVLAHAALEGWRGTAGRRHRSRRARSHGREACGRPPCRRDSLHHLAGQDC